MTFTVGFDISGLDASFKAHAQRGIGRYVRELWSYFEKNASSGELQVKSFDHRDFTHASFVDRVIDSLPAGRHTARQQLLYPLRLGNAWKKGLDVLHFPAHMDAPSWSTRGYVLTVLDLIPIIFKDLYLKDKPSWRFKFARWLEIKAIKNASLIIAISEQTASDVHRILGVPEEKIVVTPLGVDARFFKAHDLLLSSEGPGPLRKKLGIPERGQIVLYVGGIDQRKNWGLMLESFAELKAQFFSEQREAPVLVMAGRVKQDDQFPKLHAKIESLGMSDSIIIPGYIEEQDLLRLYAASSVFFFPSLYEGFGLPPLEAMAAGTPVVSSNASAMPEVIGSAGLLFNPSQKSEATEALLRVLKEADLGKSLSEAGQKRAALFTWERTGSATLQAYERMVSTGKVLCAAHPS